MGEKNLLTAKDKQWLEDLAFDIVYSIEGPMALEEDVADLKKAQYFIKYREYRLKYMAETKRSDEKTAAVEKQQDTGDPWESTPEAPTRPRPKPAKIKYHDRS